MHREHGYKELKKGCQWCTIRVNFAQFLVNNTSEILKSFKYIPACDEIYKQTIAWNISDFRNTIYDTNDEFNGSCRMIDWRRGNPYVFRITDLNELLGSNAFFARKFSSNTDSEIIKKIRDHVLNDNASSK